MTATASTLRRDLADLTTYAADDLTAVWADAKTPTAAATALRDTLPAVIDTYGVAAAALAAEWYDERRASAAVRGSFVAVPADIADSGAQALVGWAVNQATDVSTLVTLIGGGTQRRIANFARQTVMDASYADPRAAGWQRVSQGGCKTGFCDMLAARGAVYSEATADFAAHDHCECYAEPAFDGEPRPVEPYSPTLRNVTDADRARTRAYLRDH